MLIKDALNQGNKMIHKMIIKHIETIKKFKTVDKLKGNDKR